MFSPQKPIRDVKEDFVKEILLLETVDILL